MLANKSFSDEVNVVSGVPQGSVLGPLLFLIMINDIDSSVTKSKVRSFADDTRIIKGVSNVREATELQVDLNAIYDWTHDNRSQFNNDKFELMRYRHNSNDIQDFTSYCDSTGAIISEKKTLKTLVS